MTSAARWSLAATSALAVLASTTFVAAYSGIELNDIRYKYGDAELLGSVTKFVAFASPWALLISIVVSIAGARASLRRADSQLIVISSVAWLFAFSWALLCVLAWRVSSMLIGERLSEL